MAPLLALCQLPTGPVRPMAYPQFIIQGPKFIIQARLSRLQCQTRYPLASHNRLQSLGIQ